MQFTGFKQEIQSANTIPVWLKQLEWPEGKWHQQLPQPCKEITQQEYYLLGPCGSEVECESFYEICWLPDSPKIDSGWGWNEPQWSCKIYVYSSYALVLASQYYSGKVYKGRVGQGHAVLRDAYGSHYVRYFKLGCEHKWQAIPEESYMCYHARKCSKCGMRSDIDSSD